MSYNPIDRPKFITKDIRVSYILDKQIYLWTLPNGVIAITPYILAIYDKDDNLIYRFEYANNRMPISMTDKNNNRYYLHYDQVGSLRAISDTNHNIIKEIVYDTYGNILKETNPIFKVPFGFAGGLYDSDTKLIRFGYRDYDSFTGKWTAKDPIGFGGGDSNLYGYVLGNPVGLVDPMGLFFYNNTDVPVKIRPEDPKPGQPTITIPPHEIYWDGIDGLKPPFYDGDWHKVKDGTGVCLTDDKIWEIGITSIWPNCDARTEKCENWEPGRKPNGFFPE